MARLAARELTANKGFLFFNLTSIENGIFTDVSRI